jgi:hypothetical protein
MFDEYMNDDPKEEDFMPPDMDKVDHVLGITVDLYTVLSSAELNMEQQGTLIRASTNLKILLAQAISGWTLYNEESKYGDRLRGLASELYNYIVINQPEMIDSFKDIDVINEYQKYCAEGAQAAMIQDFFDPNKKDTDSDGGVD